MFDIGRMPIHAEQKDKEQSHFSFFNKSALPKMGDFRAFQSPPKLGDLGGGSGRYFIATPLGSLNSPPFEKGGF